MGFTFDYYARMYEPKPQLVFPEDILNFDTNGALEWFRYESDLKNYQLTNTDFKELITQVMDCLISGEKEFTDLMLQLPLLDRISNCDEWETEDWFGASKEMRELGNRLFCAFAEYGIITKSNDGFSYCPYMIEHMEGNLLFLKYIG